MNRRVLVPLLLLSAACSGVKQDKEAVRQGVIEHVSKNAGLDTNSMDIQVGSVSFNGSQATARVSFRPKSMQSQLMQLDYKLESKEGKWVVTGKPTAVAGPAPGAMGGGQEMPAGHPPVGQPSRP